MRVKFYTDRPFGMEVRRWLSAEGEDLVSKNPEVIVSCYNPYIIPEKELTVPAVNFHPGLLPVNRGMYPHIWPIVDGSPAGVTLHWIENGLDEGRIIAQEPVSVYANDTSGDLEKRTQREIFRLFRRMWPEIKSQVKEKEIEGKKQDESQAIYHKAREIKEIQEVPLDVARRLRACTFSDRSYAYYVENGQRYYIGVKFFSEDDIKRFEEDNHA